jgi:hypothetical protein
MLAWRPAEPATVLPADARKRDEAGARRTLNAAMVESLDRAS